MTSLVVTSISLISCFGAVAALIAAYQVYFIDIERVEE